MPFHWRDGNGSLPFPGRRIEFSELGPFGRVRYEVREYLGNETVVSYVKLYPEGVPTSVAWEWIEEEFRDYLER